MTGVRISCWIVLGWAWAIAANGLAGSLPAAPPSSEPWPPGHVVIVEEPGATVRFEPVAERVAAMVNRGVTLVTGQPSPRAAWLSLVSPADVVGLKVVSAPGPICGTRPSTVAAVIRGLLDAGLPATNIVIWDRRLMDLRAAGYDDMARRFGIRLAGSLDEGYDERVFYDRPLLGQLLWGDLEFGRHGDGIGRKSFVSRLVSRQLTKIINLPPLLNHNQAGVVGALYSLAHASVDNFNRFESAPGQLASAVPEIYALPEVGDKVVLHIIDALICQYLGEDRTLLHYAVAFDQLRFSRDPVALDILSLNELAHQRRQSGLEPRPARLELYQNAALLELGCASERLIQIERARPQTGIIQRPIDR